MICHTTGCSRPTVKDSDLCDKHQVFVPRSKPEKEAPIKARIRAAVLATGRCLCWVHDVDCRLGKTGLGKGTSDLILLVLPLGRFCGIEVKRPGYSPSDVRPEQRAWMAAVRVFGGVSGIATNESEALALVDEASQPVHLDVRAKSLRETEP